MAFEESNSYGRAYRDNYDGEIIAWVYSTRASGYNITYEILGVDHMKVWLETEQEAMDDLEEDVTCRGII